MGSFPFAEEADITWSVEHESDVYKDKDLLQVTCPDIPQNAAGARVFWNDLKTIIGSIDRSSNALLLKWVDVSLSMLGDLRSVMRVLDNNSQGLTRLDRHLAKIILEKGKTHSLFAVRFSSYVELSHNSNRTPKGRVMLAMIAQRFRLDRQRKRCISVLHLFKIPLTGFMRAEVQIFVDKCRIVMVIV